MRMMRLLDDTAFPLEVAAALGERTDAPVDRTSVEDIARGIDTNMYDAGAGVIRSTEAWRRLRKAERVETAELLAGRAQQAADAATAARRALASLKVETETAALHVVEGYSGPVEGYETRRLRRRLILDRLLALDDGPRAEAVHNAIGAGDADVLEALLTAGPLDRKALGVEGSNAARAERALLELRDARKAARIFAEREAIAAAEGRVAAAERLAASARRKAEDAIAEAAEDPEARARQVLTAEA